MKRIFLLLLFTCSISYAAVPERWPDGCDPAEVGVRLAEQFLSTSPEAYAPVGYDGSYPIGSGNNVHYSTVSLWTNALEFARMNGFSDLERRLIDNFEPFYTEKKWICSTASHVDHSIFGAVPLEIYLLNGDRRALALGRHYADLQWAEPVPEADPKPGSAPFERQVEYWMDGYSHQTRMWIDDMYMITFLQTQAYRVTGDYNYIERTGKEMVMYLNELQNEDGLFYHAPDAPYVWGRGDGWMAAGMALLLENLHKDSEYYAPIMNGYRKMMASLLRYQREDGLWGQLVNEPDSWGETSSSAMFCFAFLKGVHNGWLRKGTYGKAARKAWISLCSHLDEHANIDSVCIGTGKKNDHQHYIDRPKVNGDPHGQAPMMWICRELSR